MAAILIINAKGACARPWYYPNAITKATVNPYLQPSRVQGQCPPAWHNQMVLWEGRIEQQNTKKTLPELVLKCGSQTIPVKFSRQVRNLNVSRQGFRVAVKGRIILNRSEFKCLEGLSVILISPPQQDNFSIWAAADDNNLSNYLSWRIALHQPQMSRDQVTKTGRALVEAAEVQNLDPLLFASLIQIESAYDPRAVSPSGAMGLGQLMPFTAKGLHVSDPFDPIQNLKGSSRRLGALTREWSDRPNCNSLVLASYNAGPNCVRRLGGNVPPYAETVNYVYFIGYLRQSIKSQVEALGILSR